MSLSPSKMDAHKPLKSAASEPLTLSQALLITAGCAGLIGLCGGAFLRFSLANSPNARFLSPLQTFPALTNWTPELPQKTADSHYLPGGGSEYSEEGSSVSSKTSRADSTILTFESAAPVDSRKGSPIGDSLNTEIAVDSEPADTTTFDTFAARENGRQRTVAPLDLLKKGPDLGGIRQRQPGQSRSSLPYSENSQGDIYDDSERYADDYNSSYGDSEYDDSYEDNYYPPADEPRDSSDAYYDGQ